MRMTARSPPIMSNPFSFPEFDSSSFFQASFASPPPAPASGLSLLDDQETTAFADFLDKVGTSSDSAFMFDPKLPDPMMWGWQDETTSDYPYQPSTTAPAALTTTNMVTTPLSSERSTFALKQEDGDEDHHNNRKTTSIAPADINLDPFAALHQIATPKSASMAQPERPHISIPGLQWGSDPNFKFGGYTASASKEVSKKEDILVERAMAMLSKGGYSTNTTAANTTVNSPVAGVDRAYPGVKSADEESIVSPSKRRKSFHRKTSEEEEELESSSSSPRPKPRSKSIVTRDDLVSPTTGTSKQKKKKKPKGPKRENLSEAQKRENHIQSEQKRRNLIREGFDDLCNLVPELRGGGYSKSAILIHAANFLEQLEDGNKALQTRIKQLGGAP
ncbi:hypothetical protein AA313_de0207484 [Arthrobotrys entomopaga]|nr:hypothetical protein AA313_de0207484 [Arthrobotrys entomopaga]